MSLSGEEKIRLLEKKIDRLEEMLARGARAQYFFCPSLNCWLPAQCDDEGRLVIDPSDLDTRYHKKGEDLDVGEDPLGRSIFVGDHKITGRETAFKNILSIKRRDGSDTSRVEQYMSTADYLYARYMLRLLLGANIEWKTSVADPYRALIQWDETLWGWKFIDSDSSLLDIELNCGYFVRVFSGDMRSKASGVLTFTAAGTSKEINFFIDAVGNAIQIKDDRGIFMAGLKSGANQAAAGAAANELWVDTADNSIKIGV